MDGSTRVFLDEAEANDAWGPPVGMQFQQCKAMGGEQGQTHDAKTGVGRRVKSPGDGTELSVRLKNIFNLFFKSLACVHKK